MPKELKLPESVKFHHVDGQFWMDDNRNAYERDEKGVFHAVKTATKKSSENLLWIGILIGSFISTVVVFAARKFIEHYLEV